MMCLFTAFLKCIFLCVFLMLSKVGSKVNIFTFRYYIGVSPLENLQHTPEFDLSRGHAKS
ncbi:CLUMA_CG011598, isoform A [Clunio marinus]|uniref:CLUMA_CG011598, isoform A n=1 Tax=Clunio marinus TaxID=568069 RepID=A0A1J1IDE1_9DIPT|nr:CLUMA_CG011598, isoform A [Clunio marinus]